MCVRVWGGATVCPEAEDGHLWLSAGHPAGSQGLESIGPRREGSYRGSIVSGGGRSAQSRILAPQAASWALPPLF